MRILYVALKYDYGRPEQGYSFEHWNFHDSLLGMGHDLIYFDFATLLQVHGKAAMNRRLLEVAESEKPELMFCVLFRDELERSTVRAISDGGVTTTVNWFCDDHWRFETLSRDWAPAFNWVVTTAASALPKYHRLGYDNVIKSQWACNPFLYRKLDLPLVYDVSFVGQPHGNRREVIEAIRASGVGVHAWGQGWESGRLEQEQMIEVWNQSRINLNLSNASSRPPSRLGNLVARAGRRAARAAGLAPLGRVLRSRAKRPGRRTPSDLQLVRAHDQIKGRNFEVPGCGGFLLTGTADNLDEYYTPGREIACFDDLDGLLASIRRYLADGQARADVARAGHERTLEAHTYVHRFNEIFSRIGLPAHSGNRARGEVLEIV